MLLGKCVDASSIGSQVFLQILGHVGESLGTVPWNPSYSKFAIRVYPLSTVHLSGPPVHTSA